VNAMLATSHASVCRTLSVALSRHSGSTPPAAPLRREPAAEPEVAWSGWPLVQRRIRLLQADADKIIVHSEAIVRNVAQEV
jgi:hypothetical protein